MLVGTIHWWPAPVNVGGLLMVKLPRTKSSVGLLKDNFLACPTLGGSS